MFSSATRATLVTASASGKSAGYEGCVDVCQSNSKARLQKITTILVDLQWSSERNNFLDYCIFFFFPGYKFPWWILQRFLRRRNQLLSSLISTATLWTQKTARRKEDSPRSPEHCFLFLHVPSRSRFTFLCYNRGVGIRNTDSQTHFCH